MGRRDKGTGRARQKASPTDRHAWRFAAAIAKGKPPPRSLELDEYFESSPSEIFAALAGAARHMAPEGKDEALAVGYLFLLQGLLEHLRWRSDRGYAEAAKLIADFQAEVAAQAEAGRLSARLLPYVGGALHQSKIPCSPELAEVSAKLAPGDDSSEALPQDVRAALAAALEACGADAFAFVGTLVEAGHAMPSEVRAGLAEHLALGGTAEARAAAVLFLLDADRAVRRAVADALAQVATSLSPTDLRRLIAMRNWRAHEERGAVDAIIRKAREAETACAQWPASRVETLHATTIDGAEAQGFLLVSQAGRKSRRISSVLTKQGIADAFSGEPEPRRQIEAMFAEMDAPALPVSRPYFDRMVAHHLALSVERGEVPPLGLLEVAETIGGADWQPARLDFGEALAELIHEVPDAMLENSAVRTLLRRSSALADLEVIALPWFEDEPRIAEVVERGGSASRSRLADYILQTHMASRRGKWADVFLRTALWMRAAPQESDLCWRELAIVAKALSEGRDMTDIGLMRDIVLRTIEVLDRPPAMRL